MSIVTHFLAALLITYFVRRAYAWLLERAGLKSVFVVCYSNLGSWMTLAGVAGLIKVFDENFNIEAGLIYIVPQLFWLLFDLGYLGKLNLKR